MATNISSLIVCRKVYHDHCYGIFNGQNPLKSGFPLFMLELLSIVIISNVVRFLLKPLRQPKVVSNIIGGIIIGPSVLSHSKKFRRNMFPDNAEYVVRNVGTIGFMYFLFISGVKMDVFTLRRVDRKHWIIAVVGVIVPLVCSIAVAMVERKSLPEGTEKPFSLMGITSSLAISAFPVIYPIVKEFNLVSSEMGQMALSTSIISDVIGNIGVTIFEAGKQGEDRPIGALWYMISLIVVLGAIMGGIRQAMLWIVRTTPDGKPVDQIYVITILLGVLVIGFIADMFGLAIANGPLWLGLAVPDGPPLGAILVEKAETIMTEILLPCSFMNIGTIVDFSTLSHHWSHLLPLFFIVISGYTSKMIATLITSQYLDMTLRDGLTLSLLLSLRGEVELLLFVHWMDFKFTFLVLVSMLVTALAVPVISIVYDPTRPYMVNKRRTIQHTSYNVELQVIACINDEENLHGIKRLLDFSSPTVNRRFSVHALHHVELVGRANPLFIDHEKEDGDTDQANTTSSVHKALKIFQESRGGCMKIHPYTAKSPKRTMYQDICELALTKQACVIALSLHRESSDYLEGKRGIKKQGHPSTTASVLAHAPCSVAILVDKIPYMNTFSSIMMSSEHHFVVLFLGGADAREALAFADRAAGNEAISLTVVRFLSLDNKGDDEMEKKLDDGLVTSFWVKNEGNNRSVYREVVVKNGEETLNAIRAMNSDEYDLWIVGRKQGINPVLLQGLPNWRENTELGVIGDYISSTDFSSQASVLVVQQQVLRGQEQASGCSSVCNKWWSI
ncbi:cation/H(+) antiporter 24-like isoform X2 [Andrographis paniculata]|uniref:cation/H(+) antiporter 24-like isoform X2 n=1 Tax=Andrographis paniculata TaxID=175694 RepID=UPI0021E75789|nr:cation/H(+) antiporter 24-like isoform X2 [Andrographis paniculata]